MAHSQLASRLPERAAVEAAPAARLIVTFAVAYTFFMILPSFLSAQFSVFPLMKVEDAFTVLTPLVLISLYGLLLKQASGDHISTTALIVFLILSALWVEGHGVHLAANSISHLLDEKLGGPAWDLTYFYDEVMGHYVWYFAIVGLSVLLVAVEWRSTIVSRVSSVVPLGIAGFMYGTTFFMNIVEGQAGPLGVPFAALFTLFGLVWGRRYIRAKPLFTFFFIAYLVALVLFAVWGIYWGGLPEFSEVGIIK